MNNRLRAFYAISQPELINDIIWQNRSFYYSGDGRLCVGNNRAIGACTTLADQATTGQCVSGARFWEIGVLGDASPTPGAVNNLTPFFSVMSSLAGYGGAPFGNTNADPRLVNQYCNGARAVPELGVVLNPPTVLNLRVAATVDEGNNYVNLQYGPLYVENPVTGTTFGNYHLVGPASSAYNRGTNFEAPNHDIDNQPRPFGGGFDIGADEWR
jgi:hypothetical protein